MMAAPPSRTHRVELEQIVALPVHECDVPHLLLEPLLGDCRYGGQKGHWWARRGVATRQGSSTASMHSHITGLLLQLLSPDVKQ